MFQKRSRSETHISGGSHELLSKYSYEDPKRTMREHHTRNHFQHCGPTILDNMVAHMSHGV